MAGRPRAKTVCMCHRQNLIVEGQSTFQIRVILKMAQIEIAHYLHPSEYINEWIRYTNYEPYQVESISFCHFITDLILEYGPILHRYWLCHVHVQNPVHPNALINLWNENPTRQITKYKRIQTTNGTIHADILIGSSFLVCSGCCESKWVLDSQWAKFNVIIGWYQPRMHIYSKCCTTHLDWPIVHVTHTLLMNPTYDFYRWLSFAIKTLLINWSVGIYMDDAVVCASVCSTYLSVCNMLRSFSALSGLKSEHLPHSSRVE